MSVTGHEKGSRSLKIIYMSYIFHYFSKKLPCNFLSLLNMY